MVAVDLFHLLTLICDWLVGEMGSGMSASEVGYFGSADEVGGGVALASNTG